MTCPIYKKCGACYYPHQDYQASLDDKKRQLEKLLGLQVSAMHPSPEPYHYRNKVHAAFSYERGRGLMGKFAQNSPRVLEVQDCLLENKQAQAINHCVKKLAQDFGWSFYDVSTGRGLLKSSLVRVAEGTGQILLTLVVTQKQVPSKQNFIKALRQHHPEITGMVFNYNPVDTPFILGEQEFKGYGPGYIVDDLLGHTFRISSQSFYQVNKGVCELLYQRALELAAPSGQEVLVDAYSGIGTISLYFAPRVKQVYGVENNREAVKDAIANAKHNQIDNAFFLCEDTGAYLEGLVQAGDEPDILVLDPARSGLDARALRAVRALKVPKLIYISCNPEALAAELPHLRKTYRVQAVEAFDMFPWTEHVETLVLLSRIRSDRKPQDNQI